MPPPCIPPEHWIGWTGSFTPFHVSGGTTEGLLVSPGDPGLQVQRICATRDLHAGQVIDRVGVMLGLSFPLRPCLGSGWRQSCTQQDQRCVRC